VTYANETAPVKPIPEIVSALPPATGPKHGLTLFTTGTVPLVVTFTDSSSGSPTSWSWDFGDGYTSTFENPQHTYNTAGTYAVNHSATNLDGIGWISKTAYIIVNSQTDFYVYAYGVGMYHNYSQEPHF
jgi:uncharacterized membrane protein